MIKRPPVLIDLHAASADVGVVQTPNHPNAWTQPALTSLLKSADAWPVNVATLPYAGCAMISWTRRARNALVRLAPATTYIRATVTHCRPLGYPAAGIDLYNYAELTGSFDGTVVRVNVESSNLASFSWPPNAQMASQHIAQTTSAIIDPASSYENRQIRVNEQIGAQTEIVETDRHLALTVWAGDQSADLVVL